VLPYLEELVKRVKKAKKKGLPLPLLDINKSLEAAKQLEKELKPVDPMYGSEELCVMNGLTKRLE